MIIRFCLLLFFSWLFGWAVHAQEKNFSKHIQYLSADSLEGRLAGSIGEKKAAEYIGRYFASVGLDFYLEDTYFQSFEYNYKTNPHDTSGANGTVISTQNVIGYLDNNSSKTIVLGGHYDHLGRNEHKNSTLPHAQGLIHNGADDNASGVAMILELAKELRENAIKEGTNFLFICFSGEEDGLRGSKFFSENKLRDYPSVQAMINLDMVGRMDSLNHLNVGGFGSSSVFDEILSKNTPGSVLLEIDSSGVGPSDHASFYLKQVPVLFFNTGSHEDYHKPSDDEDKINYTSMHLIYEIVKGTVMDLSELSSIDFRETKVKEQRRYKSAKVSLGVMPNYTFDEGGLLIDAVVVNKPASKGGIIAGDIILKIGTCVVSDIYGYMDCLGGLDVTKPVNIEILRNGQHIVKQVEFE
jgi:Zn-dependent M28 family amino/carboxypeptidase